MDKLEQIEAIVKADCESASAKKYTFGDWNHIKVVRKYAVMLAKKLEADVEVCDMAALLHDIGRLRYGSKNHAKTSAEDAEKILKKLDYDDEFIQKTKAAVKSHRGAEGPEPITIEEKIVATADAMSHFDLFHIMLFDMGHKGMLFKDALDYVQTKIERAWKKISLIPEAQEMFEEKYKALKLVFN